MKVVVLLNATAGTADKTTDPEAVLRDAFAGHGVEATIKPMPGPEIAEAARAFVKAPSADALVVAGGDGTISAVAGAVAGSDVALGVVAMGTLNHFAKDLGLPLEPKEAAAVIAAGRTRKVDVAELNGRVFVNNSSVGLYPFMVARRDEHRRAKGVGKLLATLPALWQTLSDATWHTLGIAAAGEREAVRTPSLFVGNNQYETDLADFGSRKSLDRGALDVHVIKQQTRLGILLLPFKSALGRADPVHDVQSFRCAELEITSRSPRLQVSLDGEICTIDTPLRYRSRPGALTVFAADRA